MEVDCGSYGVRQVVSGIAKFFQPDQLVGKQGIFVMNLKPRKMMGLASEAMLLLAKDDTGGMAMATVDASVPNGSRLH